MRKQLNYTDVSKTEANISVAVVIPKTPSNIFEVYKPQLLQKNSIRKLLYLTTEKPRYQPRNSPVVRNMLEFYTDLYNTGLQIIRNIATRVLAN